MDDLVSAPSSAPSAPPPPLTAPSLGLPKQQSDTPRAHGRPSSDPDRRASADERYAKLKEIEQALPDQAKDYRFAIYRAKPHRDEKAESRPVETILFNRWKELNLVDPAALEAYLQEEHGEDRYLIEPQDQHKHRIDKFPTWVVEAHEDDWEPEYARTSRNAPPQGRGRNRRRRGFFMPHTHPDDLDDMIDDDDPVGSRGNVADFLAMHSNQQQQQQAAAMKSSNDLVSLMMMMNQQQQQMVQMQQQQRQEEERRLEERRAEERRREEEERRAEERRAEERRAEERRREEERRTEDRRRDEERRADNMKMILGMVGAAAPVLPQMFKREESPVMATLIANLSKKDADPVTMMLLKSMMDKGQNNETIQTMIASMGEMSRMTSQLQAEQMKSVLNTSNDLNATLMKRAMEMALNGEGNDDDDGSMIGKVMSALSNAGNLVDSLTGGKQQAQPQVGVQPQPQQYPAPQPGPQPNTQPGAQPHPQQVAYQPQQAPAEPPPLSGIPAVGAALMSIQQQAYQTEEELAGLLQFAITNMPPNLEAAVKANDQDQVLEICTPSFMQSQELMAWVMSDGVSDWLLSYLPVLSDTLNQLEATQGGAVTNLDEVSDEDKPDPEDEVDTEEGEPDNHNNINDDDDEVDENAP